MNVIKWRWEDFACVDSKTVEGPMGPQWPLRDFISSLLIGRWLGQIWAGPHFSEISAPLMNSFPQCKCNQFWMNSIQVSTNRLDLWMKWWNETRLWRLKWMYNFSDWVVHSSGRFRAVSERFYSAHWKITLGLRCSFRVIWEQPLENNVRVPVQFQSSFRSDFRVATGKWHRGSGAVSEQFLSDFRVATGKWHVGSGAVSEWFESGHWKMRSGFRCSFRAVPEWFACPVESSGDLHRIIVENERL